jgi:hypothetical protein
MHPIERLLDIYPQVADKLVRAGVSPVKMAYFVDIDMSGNLLAVLPTDAELAVVSRARTNGIAPNVGWDKPVYIFGYTIGDKVERAEKCQQAFYDELCEMNAQLHNPFVQSVITFLESAPLDQLEQLVDLPNHAFSSTGPKSNFCAIRVIDDQNIPHIICQMADVLDYALNKFGQATNHPFIKTSGKMASGANGAVLVSYNVPAFDSFLHLKDYQRDGISASDITKYSQTLQYLMDNYFIKFTENSGCVYFFKNAEQEDDFLADLFGDYVTNPVVKLLNVKKKINALWTSNESAVDVDLYVFFVHTNVARLFISDLVETKLSVLAKKVDNWLNTMGSQTVKQIAEQLAPKRGTNSSMMQLLKREIISHIFDRGSLHRSSACAIDRLSGIMAEDKNQPFTRKNLTNFLKFAGAEQMPTNYSFIVGRLLAVYEQMQQIAARASSTGVQRGVVEKYLRKLTSKPQDIARITEYVHWEKLIIRQYGKSEFTTNLLSLRNSLFASLINASVEKDATQLHLGFAHQRAVFDTERAARKAKNAQTPSGDSVAEGSREV